MDAKLAERVAEAVLQAAGSGFRHYMPATKVRIIEEAQKVLQSSAVYNQSASERNELTVEKLLEVKAKFGTNAVDTNEYLRVAQLALRLREMVSRLLPYADCGYFTDKGTKKLVAEAKGLVK